MILGNFCIFVMPVVDLKFSNRVCTFIHTCNRCHAILEFACAVFRWFIVFGELQLVKDFGIIYNNPRSSICRSALSAVSIRDNEKKKKIVEKIHFGRKVCASIRVGVEVFDPNCQITGFRIFCKKKKGYERSLQMRLFDAMYLNLFFPSLSFFL